MSLSETLTAKFNASDNTLDVKSILLAFSLLPFFLCLKLYYAFWQKFDQNIDPIPDIANPKTLLFIGSDLLLCLGLSLLYMAIFSVGRIFSIHPTLKLTSIFAIHFFIVIFSIISLKVSQIYGSPLTIFHFRMADDLSVMTGSILSYVDIPGIIMLFLGISTFFSTLHLHNKWTIFGGISKWNIWIVVFFVSISVFSLNAATFSGVYTYGLKKNALINFVRYYESLPDEHDYDRIAKQLRAKVPENSNWTSLLHHEYTRNITSESYTGIAKGKNLIVIVLESTADSYIDPKTTPNLYKIRQNSLVFSNYFTTAVNSFQSNFSIFFSDYVPSTSQIGHPNKIYGGPFPGTSLAEALNREGYATALFNSGFLSYTDIGYIWQDKGVEFVQGAKSVLEATGGSGWVWGSHETQTVSVMNSWIDQNVDRPFFATYVTAYPHHPYTTPTNVTPFANDNWRDRFRNSLFYVDQNIGDLLAFLEQKGLRSNTAIAIVADHGETLDTDIAGHGIRMDLNEIQVPFFINVPGKLPGQVDRPAPANHLDLAPTLASALDISAPAEWAGRDLLAPSLQARRLFVQHNGNNGQNAIIDDDVVFVGDAKTGNSKISSHVGGKLEPVAASDAIRKRIDDYGNLSRQFKDQVLLSHLERACELSDDPQGFCKSE